MTPTRWCLLALAIVMWVFGASLLLADDCPEAAA